MGFRPFIYNLAHEYGLKGWVYNYSGGVEIEVEGDKTTVREFISDIRDKHPPMACILDMEVRESLPLQGYRDFEIRESREEENLFVPVSPDISICQDCLDELFDPQDRRFHYPFINCTNCGPRFTIIADVHATEVLMERVSRAGLLVEGQSFLPLDALVRILYNPNMEAIWFVIPGLCAMILQTQSISLTAASANRFSPESR